MIFSTRSEYGVMMLTDLARHYGKGPLALSEIAEHLGVARDAVRDGKTKHLTVAYLEQIVPDLRKHGFVESVRGAKGGYVLARSPESIKMGSVIRALEGRIAVMSCATDDDSAPNCNHEDVCTAPILWLRVRDAVTQALDSTTLADLAPSRRTLTMALPAQFGKAFRLDESDPVETVTILTESNN